MPASALYSYDPSQLAIIVSGQALTGFADGTVVTVSRNADAWSFKPSVDGGGTRAKTVNRSGRIQVMLQQGSSSNDYLSSLAIADDTSGTGVVPCLMRDASGRTLVSALNAWVVKIPDLEFGRDVADRTWIIETDNLTIFAGGNFLLPGGR